MAKKVGVIVGSIRRDSINRRLAKALMGLAPPTLTLEFIEIGDLPLYNQDLDATPPVQWQTFKKHVASVDAILFVSPEYNRSMPAALKNAIDIGSRPYGQSAWNGKPGAVVTASPSAIGGFGSNHAVRQTLVFLNVPVMQQPEAYIGHADKLVSADGQIPNPDTKVFLEKFMMAFADWVARNAVAA